MIEPNVDGVLSEVIEETLRLNAYPFKIGFIANAEMQERNYLSGYAADRLYHIVVNIFGRDIVKKEIRYPANTKNAVKESLYNRLPVKLRQFCEERWPVHYKVHVFDIKEWWPNLVVPKHLSDNRHHVVRTAHLDDEAIFPAQSLEQLFEEWEFERKLDRGYRD